MQKKGSARDVIVIVVLFFVIAVGLFIVNYSSKQVIQGITSVPIVNDTPGISEVFDNTQDAVNRADYLVFAFLIGLLISLVITGYYIGGNKIFMVLYFIFIILAVLVSMVLSNAWNNITTELIFGTTINNFPISDHILSNFAIYTAGFGFVGLIAMFAKPPE